MNNFHYIQGDFLKQRSGRIGASDMPALIPNPEKPTESLAGYKRTPITTWEEKTGRTPRTPAGLPAEMGHWNEPKATELFMRPVFGRKVSNEWLFKRMQFEILKTQDINTDPRIFQEGTILHNTQHYNDNMIVHPDGIYMGDRHTLKAEQNSKGEWFINAHSLKINLSKPFLIEAKSARFFAAKRPKGSIVSGYDTGLKTWQGIPLKHYVQIQFQLALLDVDICYLPLLYDTSTFHVWEIKADRKRQNLLIDLAGRLAWHIKNDIAPKEMAINSNDIKKLYPDINEDFVYVTDDEREKAVEFAKKEQQATAQLKIWKAKKQEASDSLAVMLRDRGELKDADGSICKWQERKGAEKVKALKSLKSENELEYKYLKRKGLINTGKDSKFVSVTYKDLEE